MRIKILVLIFVCCIQSYGQEIRHDAKVQVTGIPFGHYGFSYEVVLNESIGVNLSVNVNNKLVSSEYYDTILSENNSDYSDSSINPEIRYYFDPDYDCDGRFMGLYVRLRKSTIENTGSDDGADFGVDHEVEQSAFGFTYGYKYVTDYGLFFESSFGLGYAFNHEVTFKDSMLQEDWDENSDDFDPIDYEYYHPALDKIDYRLSISIGWRFNMD